MDSNNDIMSYIRVMVLLGNHYIRTQELIPAPLSGKQIILTLI
jgi:hypothetical protein